MCTRQSKICKLETSTKLVMEQYTTEERVKIIQAYYENRRSIGSFIFYHAANFDKGFTRL